MTDEMVATVSPIEAMALTVWAEARGESEEGQRAVAWVIRHRVEHPRWWGRDLVSVCKNPAQFSCWRKDDPNYKKLIDPNTKKTESYQKILKICRDVMAADPSTDPLPSADSYCTVSIAPKTYWAKGRTPVKTIGHHAFYSLEI